MIDRAILLAAGLGSRLLPLTAEWPKCLIEVGGQTILEHQVAALRSAGVRRIVVVGGYRFDQLERFVAERWSTEDRPELVFNPFFAVSSSIGSVWAAREYLNDEFCLLNGDTVYDPALVADGLARLDPGLNLFVEPITAPESDDMLVRMADERIIAVGKGLSPLLAHHRSLGFVAWKGAGANDYVDALQQVIGGVEGAQSFHHAIVDKVAREQGVHGVAFEGGQWTEIDRPDDIARWGGSHPAAEGTAAA